MSDNEFIAYCAGHSTTPRRLFNGSQIKRLAKLAKLAEVDFDPKIADDAWVSADLSALALLAKRKD